jgi:hypothetical protein
VPATTARSPRTGPQLVDEYFIENRTRLLEVAAYLDRLDRAGGDGGDFRMRAFREALDVRASGAGDETRLLRIQMIFSDPTTEPMAELDQKSARGAYDRWTGQ